MKKLLVVLLAALMLTACAAPAPEAEPTPAPEAEPVVAELPAPVDTTKMYKPSKDAAETACEAGVYAAACSSINSENLVEYLGREDVLYIDLRDYNDYAKKHLKNFEVVPYFAAVMSKEPGTQLYSGTPDAPVATYEESDVILNQFFPKDKTLFIMCQSGGRVAQLMKLLEAKGYDMSKIYNVGGMGQFTGSEFREYTTDTAELTIEATYSFEGLTPAAK